MLTLIHGDNELQTRRELQLIKEANKGKEIVVLSKPDALTLRQQLASSNMFYDDRLIVVEQFFEKGVAAEVVEFLATLPKETTGVFVERKQLDGRKSSSDGTKAAKGKKTDKVLKGKKLLDELKSQIPSMKIIVCNDYSLFNFLDALVPGNSPKLVKEYQALLDNDYTPEEIYYMIVDHMRNLVIANDLGANGLPGMHQFRQGKIVSQSNRFTEKQIITAYQKLFQLETAQKLKRVGEGSPFSMEEDLRFFLATSFAK